MRPLLTAVLAAPFLLAPLLACGAPGARGAAATTGTSSPPAPIEGQAPAPGSDQGLDRWQRVLDAYAVDGGVDYAALAMGRGDLDAFVAGVAEARPVELPREGRIAFWINAYNALVLASVLDRWPGIESVIRVEGFFDAETHRVAGEELTLNQIERRALDEGDPRVHFAVVCASVGCPDLSPEAFRPELLEEQLAQQTAAYLADPTKGLRYDGADGVLYLSSIFDWYAADFGGDAVAWILPRLPDGLAEEIRKAEPRLQYLDYDWSLNARSRAAP